MNQFLKNGLEKVKSVFKNTNTKLSNRLPMIAGLILATVCAAGILFGTVKTVKIWDGTKLYKIRTISGDTKAIVASLNLKSEKYILDRDNDGTVLVKYTFPVHITCGDKTVTKEVTEDTVQNILLSAGFTVDDYDLIEPAKDKVISSETYIDYYDIEYVKGEAEWVIPYKTNVTYSSKQSGTTVVNGCNGIEKVYYTQKFVNGVLEEKVIDNRVVLKQPIDAKKVIGTKKKNSTPTQPIKTSSNTPSISTLKPASPIALNSKGIPLSYKKSVTVQATAYTYTGHNCSTGVAPQPGYIAVNPKIIPYGTKMYIVSKDGKFVYGYAIAADTGGFAKKRPTNVDLFFSTKAACTSFGRRDVVIYFLP